MALSLRDAQKDVYNGNAAPLDIMDRWRRMIGGVGVEQGLSTPKVSFDFPWRVGRIAYTPRDALEY
jgi:hypothetical protein